MYENTAYCPQDIHNDVNNDFMSDVVMSNADNVTVGVWKEKKDKERKVVIQYPKFSTEQDKRVEEDISRIMEALAADSMDKKLKENGGNQDE